MSDAIEAARQAYLRSCGAYMTEGECPECEFAIQHRLGPAIAAYRDSEIEALRAKLADCQAVIRKRGHAEDCPASSSACAICGLHELLHPCVTYFGDSQKHNFNRGPCSDACGHDRTTGEKA